MADAFGTFVGIDDIKWVARGNGVIGTFGFTDITVNAFIGDFKRHGGLFG